MLAEGNVIICGKIWPLDMESINGNGCIGNLKKASFKVSVSRLCLSCSAGKSHHGLLQSACVCVCACETLRIVRINVSV